MKKNLNEAIEKFSYLEAVFNGGPGSGNFSHAGRPGLVGGSGKGQGSVGKDASVVSKRDFTVIYEGQERSPEEVSDIVQNHRDDEILGKIEKNLGNIKELEKSVLSDRGWIPREIDGVVVGELNDKIHQQKFILGENERKVMNNGKKYLEDNNGEFYVSKPSDIDGVAVYTTESPEDALTYADGDEKRICRLIVDKSNFIQQADLDRIRGRLYKKANSDGLKRGLIKREGKNPKCDVKDTILASMFGYDGIIRPKAREYVVINPETLYLDRTDLPKKVNDIISKIDGLGCYNKNKEIKKMKLTKEQYNFVKQKLEELEKQINGGKGSGNFGHAGRPGYVGGSGKGSSISSKKDGGSGVKSGKSEQTVKGIKQMDKVETPKGFQNEAITGVDGNESYGTGLRKIPRMDNLTKEQARLENEICDCYENPEKLEKAMDDYVKYAEQQVATGEKDRLTFETDAVKQMLPGWGTDDELHTADNDRKNPEKSDQERAEAQRKYDSIMEHRQALNSIYHQTANAICKAAFEREAAKYAEKGENANIVVTSGGCGAGKGFGQGMLASGNTDMFYGKSNVVNDFSDKYKGTVLVWDSAGDQCSSELYWLKAVAKNNNLKMVVLQTNNNNPDMYSAMASQQIGRALKDGRMVASKVSADSYVIGNKNIMAFYNNNKNDGNISFYTVGNVGRDYGYDKTGKVVKKSDNVKTKPLSISKGVSVVAADGKKIINAINDAAGKLLANSPSEATQAANIVSGTHFYDNHRLKR